MSPVAIEPVIMFFAAPLIIVMLVLGVVHSAREVILNERAINRMVRHLSKDRGVDDLASLLNTTDIRLKSYLVN